MGACTWALINYSCCSKVLVNAVPRGYVFMYLLMAVMLWMVQVLASQRHLKRILQSYVGKALMRRLPRVEVACMSPWTVMRPTHWRSLVQDIEVLAVNSSALGNSKSVVLHCGFLLILRLKTPWMVHKLIQQAPSKLSHFMEKLFKRYMELVGTSVCSVFGWRSSAYSEGKRSH